jgi:hypothetical protein
MMPKIHQEFNKHNGATGLYFFCPGCKFPHAVNTDLKVLWGFNGDFEKPTLTPSVLLRSTKFTDLGNRQHREWIDAGYPKRDEPFDSVPHVCHSFVTDGRIQFLGDSTHEFAGQTVELPDFKWEDEDESV